MLCGTRGCQGTSTPATAAEQNSPVTDVPLHLSRVCSAELEACPFFFKVGRACVRLVAKLCLTLLQPHGL